MHYSERMVSSIQNDPVVSKNVAALKDLSKIAAERGSFLMAQLKSLKKKLLQDSDPFWTEIMDHLKARGSLPQSWRHSTDDYLRYDDDNDAIYAIHDCECPRCSLRKALDSATKS